MSALTDVLVQVPLFSKLPAAVVRELAGAAVTSVAMPGDTISMRPVDYIVLLSGGLDVVHRESGDRLMSLAVPEGSSKPAWLYALTPQTALRAVSSADMVILDGEKVDRALRAVQELAEPVALPAALKGRVASLARGAPFDRLAQHELATLADAMEPIEANAGADIVRQGQPGNFFYVIESGTADVWRAGPLTGGKPVKVATLDAGQTFGEEALLKEGTRNATVTMKQPGRLLRLAKDDFNRLLRDRFIAEIAPQVALRLLLDKTADLIDCRYDIEYELQRLPGARLMPLDEIRERAKGLNREREYLVYCRSGERSRVASYLMRGMGLKAHAIRGGLTQWPYEIEQSASGLRKR